MSWDQRARRLGGLVADVFGMQIGTVQECRARSYAAEDEAMAAAAERARRRALRDDRHSKIGKRQAR